MHQGASARTLHLRVSQAHLRYNSLDCLVCHQTVSGAPPDCPLHHRTVRCTNGATATCAQRSTLQSEQYRDRSQSSGQRGTGLSGAAPDCPVRHRTVRCHMKTKLQRSEPNDLVTWLAHRTLSGVHRTVRCTEREIGSNLFPN